jgi:3-oxoacyl-[acyl-carrier protein] reductase
VEIRWLSAAGPCERLLFGEASRRLPGLDIVVCNAAMGMPKPIDEVTEDDYDREMAADAKGPFFVIQHAGRMLRDGGRIIAISSMSTRLHNPVVARYTGEGECARDAVVLSTIRR